MERWAANTLRTLGIILVSGLVLVGSLLLALLSLCAYGGDYGGRKHPDQGLLYLLGAIAVIAIGILIIAKLARGIGRSSLDAQIAAAIAAPDVQGAGSIPFHFSPAGEKSVQHLMLAMIVQIAASCVVWLLDMRMPFRNPVWGQPYVHRWTLFLLMSFILENLPYGILIAFLLKRPDRRTFTYAVAVPAALILQSLFITPVFGLLYLRNYTQYPAGIVVAVLPFLLNILILVLAYKAIQQVGLHPQVSSLVVAGVTTFIYFVAIHLGTPILYRFGGTFAVSAMIGLTLTVGCLALIGKLNRKAHPEIHVTPQETVTSTEPEAEQKQ